MSEGRDYFADSLGERLLRKPITGIAGCWARRRERPGNNSYEIASYCLPSRLRTTPIFKVITEEICGGEMVFKLNLRCNKLRFASCDHGQAISWNLSLSAARNRPSSRQGGFLLRP
jgi:hypothetical protein